MEQERPKEQNLNRDQKEPSRPSTTLEDRLKILDSLRGIFKGGPSMTDELIKDRRSYKW